MHTHTLKLNLPEELFGLGLKESDIKKELSKLLILSLYRQSRISSGRAAKYLGIPRRDFLDIIDEEGLSYIDLNKKELEVEIATSRSIKVHPKKIKP